MVSKTLLGGGLKPLLRGQTLALGFAVGHKHKSYSVRVKDFYLVNASKQQTYKPRFNTGIKEDE